MHAWASAGQDVADGPRRRVPGLRSEEVAQLAGLSVDYVVRLGQDRAPRPSCQVLTALTRTSWTPPPAGTEELALIVQDPDVPGRKPDVPGRKPAVHALTVGIDPSLQGIPENGLTGAGLIRGLQHGRSALGRRGWAGPLPLPSHAPRAYVFQLFALMTSPICPRDSPSPTHSAR